MAFLFKDNLTEAHKGAKLVKELLEDLYLHQLPEDGDEYNKALINTYADSIRLVMSLEQTQNAQIQPIKLKEVKNGNTRHT